MDTKDQLSPISRSLHWLVAIIMIGLVSVGFIMSTFEVRALFPIHKSIGVLALLLILPRVIWRLKNGWPTPVRNYLKWEQLLSKLTHWVLILGTLIMPISGIVFSIANGRGLNVFGLQLVANNPDPANPEKMLALNKALGDFGHETHEIIGYVMAVAIVLHIAGAIKHHVKDKDRTLLRMMGR